MSIYKLTHVTPFDVLHGDEVMTLSFVEIKDGTDVGVIQGRGEACFALKTAEVGFSGSQFCRQNLYYYCTAQFRISRFIDSALPANAKLLENLIVV
jgi:hypothetical protein